MIRSQRYLNTALDHVEAVRKATKPEEAEAESSKRDKAARRRIYGGLCHTFPVLVRTNGLCQTLAFVAAKGASSETPTPPRAQAYRDVRDHVADILDIKKPNGDRGDPLEAVRHAELTEYLRYTRTILDAWVYYRRFADSVLEVKAGGRDETAP